MFETGSLEKKVAEATTRALACGALEPIETEFEFIEDAGVRFLVRIVSPLVRKERQRVFDAASSGRRNPFSPYDPALYVADASSTHVCLLNKFNVVDRHLLIVTREFEPQESPLGEEDFTAIWRCMTEYPSLGFYNSGKIAGASQPHKHLQLVPLPLAPSGPRIPIEPLIDAAELSERVGQVGRLPFRHAAARLDAAAGRSPSRGARASLPLYHALLEAVGLSSQATFPDGRPADYNLLVARSWMLLAPRSRESFESISINALGLAGAMLVRDERQRRVLIRRGPMAALRHVTEEAN